LKLLHKYQNDYLFSERLNWQKIPMAPKSNKSRPGGFCMTLSKGLLMAALLHLTVGLVYIYRIGYIDNIISRYRQGKSTVKLLKRFEPSAFVTAGKRVVSTSLSKHPQKSVSSSSDYQIDINAFQKDDIILVRGWVSEGSPCDLLEIGIELSCETGKIISLRTVVERVGVSRSRLISLRRWVGRVPGKAFPKWLASVSAVSCISD
jgi:hypothetical protein